MRTPGRMAFLGKEENQKTVASSSNQLRAIESSRVSNIEEFDRLFSEAVKRQQDARESLNKSNTKSKMIISDDAFGDLDKELGF